MLGRGRNLKSKGKEWCDGSKGTIYNGKEFNGKKRKKSFKLLFVTPTRVALVHKPPSHDYAHT